jgi:hypothetical protein
MPGEQEVSVKVGAGEVFTSKRLEISIPEAPFTCGVLWLINTTPAVLGVYVVAVSESVVEHSEPKA